LSDPRGVRTVGCRGPWDESIEPDWFAKPTSPRTSGFSCSQLSLHCSRVCAAETRSAHPCSLRQDRRSWLHLRHAVLVLLSHHWLLTCSRVACCLARAHACGIRPSRLLAKHFARIRGCAGPNASGPSPSLRRATLAPFASARAMVCSHLDTSKSSTSHSQCRLISSAAFSSTASVVLHARSRCSRADPPAAAALQLLPHRERPSCTQPVAA
jgi:hypothetical protein